MEKENLTYDRFAGYFATFRTLLTRSSRYLAYSSDVGEAVRPLVNPRLVSFCYGVSWFYVGYDVTKHTDNFKKRMNYDHHWHPEVRKVALERFTFQVLASMLLPALTIHTLVTFLTRQCTTGKLINLAPKFKRWGPTVGGLAVVPFLPYLFDRPVEQLVEYIGSQLSPEPKPYGPFTLELNDDNQKIL